MKKSFLYTLILSAFAALSPAFSQAEKKLCVASLNPVLSDFASEIGGSAVEIFSVLPSGKDPHLFEPTPKEIREMAGADIILASGFGLENYLEKLKPTLRKKSKIVEVGKSVQNPILDCPESHGACAHGKHGDGEAANPHWWLSVNNAESAVETIARTFSDADPSHRELYTANAAAYLKKLHSLKKWIANELSSLPQEKRILVTSHDALAYFARDYGFEVLPIVGINTADQPTSKKIRSVIDTIRSRKVKAIFVENTGNLKILSEIAKESGANLGGTLFVDGLGESPTDTYEKMMRHNVSTIAKSLR